MRFLEKAGGHVVFLLSSCNFSCLISLPSAPSALMSPRGRYYATTVLVDFLFYWWALLKKKSWTFKVMEWFFCNLSCFSRGHVGYTALSTSVDLFLCCAVLLRFYSYSQTVVMAIAESGVLRSLLLWLILLPVCSSWVSNQQMEPAFDIVFLIQNAPCEAFFPSCVMCFISVSISIPSRPPHWIWYSICFLN